MCETDCEEECPICLDNLVSEVSECGHKYCGECLSKISKCALCRFKFKNFVNISNTIYNLSDYNNRNNHNLIRELTQEDFRRILSGIAGLAYSS